MCEDCANMGDQGKKGLGVARGQGPWVLLTLGPHHLAALEFPASLGRRGRWVSGIREVLCPADDGTLVDSIVGYVNQSHAVTVDTFRSLFNRAGRSVCP